MGLYILHCSKAEIWTPHSKNLKHTLQVKKSLKHDNINNLCALRRNDQAKLYLPTTFQTSDIELLSPKRIYISLTHPSVTIFINCVQTR